MNGAVRSTAACLRAQESAKPSICFRFRKQVSMDQRPAQPSRTSRTDSEASVQKNTRSLIAPRRSASRDGRRSPTAAVWAAPLLACEAVQPCCPEEDIEHLARQLGLLPV